MNPSPVRLQLYLRGSLLETECSINFHKIETWVVPKQNKKTRTIYQDPGGHKMKLFNESRLKKKKASILKMYSLSREILNVFFLKDNKITGIFEPFISSIQMKQINKQTLTTPQASLCLWALGKVNGHSLSIPAVRSPSRGLFQKW
jgi:hypothetical protein